MTSETVRHFFHIKVTVGDVWRGRGSMLSFLWKTLDYLAFTSASGGLEFPSAGEERVPEPAVVKRRTVRTC